MNKEQMFKNDISRAETKLQQNPDNCVWQSAYADLKTIEIYNNSRKLKRLLILLGVLYVPVGGKYKLKFNIFAVFTLIRDLISFLCMIGGTALMTSSVFHLRVNALHACIMAIMGYVLAAVGRFFLYRFSECGYRDVWNFLRGCSTKYDIRSYTHIL